MYYATNMLSSLINKHPQLALEEIFAVIQLQPRSNDNNKASMRVLTAAAFLLAFVPFTLQRCLDQVYAQESCRYYMDYTGYRSFGCNNYYETHCSEVTNKLESVHMESVHKIIVKSGNVTSLTVALFAGFNNVRSITMTESNVASIEPNTFSDLHSLKSVNLTENVVEVLSQESFNSNSLESLDLSNNNINIIQYNPFTSVTKLILHHNRIADISNLVTVCTSLQTLDLSYNNINEIELLETCQNLVSLNASHNALSKFIVSSNQSFKLNGLDLSYNELSNISSWNLCNLDGLLSLSLSNNPLFYAKNPSVDLFQNTLQLEMLSLSATGIQEVYVGTFGKLSNLKLLDLSRNNLTTLPKGIFRDLKSLERLFINDNSFKYFDNRELAKLTKIDLNDNLFTCDTLVDIVNILTNKNIDVVNGNSIDTKNILGINCLGTVEDAEVMINQFNRSADNQNEKHYELLDKVQQMMQQLLFEQENRSSVLIEQQNKSEVYWRTLARDYKGFFQTFLQSISDALRKLTDALTAPKSTRNTAKMTEVEIGNYSWEQWKFLHRNFTEVLRSDRREFLGAIRNSLDMLQSNPDSIDREANIIRNASYAAVRPFTSSSNFTSSNVSAAAPNESNTALIFGTYGIFLVLLVGLVLLLLSKFKSYRDAKIKQEECNPLNNLAV